MPGMYNIRLDGRPVVPQVPELEEPAPRMSRLALASLGLSLFTILFSSWEIFPDPYYLVNLPAFASALLCAVLALFLGMVALYQTRRGKGVVGGARIAVAGIVLTLLGVGISCLLLTRVL